MSTPDNRFPNESQGKMRTTRPATLLVALLATAGLAWLLIDRFYDWLPDLPWLPPITMIGLALGEAGAAWQTKARIEHRAGMPPVEPLLVARFVVLAKASALAGALFTGLYLGIFTWLVVNREFRAHAPEDLPAAALGLAGSLGLVVASLWLERSCRVPPPPPGDDVRDS
jgi:hypothetical protein